MIIKTVKHKQNLKLSPKQVNYEMPVFVDECAVSFHLYEGDNVSAVNCRS
jgi:hypothetical protein